MENSVTITLEKYHSLLDSETELKELIKNGKIKVVYSRWGSSNCIHYISDIESVELLTENIVSKDRRIDDLDCTNDRLRRDNAYLKSRNESLNTELEKIKKHWAYRLFIKKGD